MSTAPSIFATHTFFSPTALFPSLLWQMFVFYLGSSIQCDFSLCRCNDDPQNTSKLESQTALHAVDRPHNNPPRFLSSSLSRCPAHWHAGGRACSGCSPCPSKVEKHFLQATLRGCSSGRGGNCTCSLGGWGGGACHASCRATDWTLLGLDEVLHHQEPTSTKLYPAFSQAPTCNDDCSFKETHKRCSWDRLA
jgi:hypothetical protein